MPVGALIAMHTKNFFPSADPAWFYLHAGCQLTAYILGVTGWATGLKLASGSADHHQLHRFFGTLLFCMATLQVLYMYIHQAFCVTNVLEIFSCSSYTQLGCITLAHHPNIGGRTDVATYFLNRYK